MKLHFEAGRAERDDALNCKTKGSDLAITCNPGLTRMKMASLNASVEKGVIL